MAKERAIKKAIENLYKTKVLPDGIAVFMMQQNNVEIIKQQLTIPDDKTTYYQWNDTSFGNIKMMSESGNPSIKQLADNLLTAYFTHIYETKKCSGLIFDRKLIQIHTDLVKSNPYSFCKSIIPLLIVMFGIILYFSKN